MACLVDSKYSLLVLFAFHFLTFFFECIWLHHSAAFFEGVRELRSDVYQFVLTSLSAFLMSLFTLAYSAAAQAFGSGSGTIAVFSLTALISWRLCSQESQL